jgi:hypothetical protein
MVFFGLKFLKEASSAGHIHPNSNDNSVDFSEAAQPEIYFLNVL